MTVVDGVVDTVAFSVSVTSSGIVTVGITVFSSSVSVLLVALSLSVLLLSKTVVTSVRFSVVFVPISVAFNVELFEATKGSVSVTKDWVVDVISLFSGLSLNSVSKSLFIDESTVWSIDESFSVIVACLTAMSWDARTETTTYERLITKITNSNLPKHSRRNANINNFKIISHCHKSKYFFFLNSSEYTNTMNITEIRNVATAYIIFYQRW